MYYVYVLQSLKSGKRYTGYTNNLQRRLWEHNHTRKGYVSRHQPFCIIHAEYYLKKQEATVRERFLKRLKGGNEFTKILNGLSFR